MVQEIGTASSNLETSILGEVGKQLSRYRTNCIIYKIKKVKFKKKLRIMRFVYYITRL